MLIIPVLSFNPHSQLLRKNIRDLRSSSIECIGETILKNQVFEKTRVRLWSMHVVRPIHYVDGACCRRSSCFLRERVNHHLHGRVWFWEYCYSRAIRWKRILFLLFPVDYQANVFSSPRVPRCHRSSPRGISVS